MARLRSALLRGIAACSLPRSVLVTRGPRAPRRVALTFDDGPDAMTRQYLDVLASLGARATFFFVGENAERERKLVEETASRGHEIGGHGWSHAPFPSMSAARLSDELARTAATLPRTRARPLVRPPRGTLSLRALRTLASRGFTTVLWSIDSDDCRTRDPRTIERRVCPRTVRPGDVVLFHELQPWTLSALPRIVGALRGAGYEIVTVGDLMERAS